MEKNIDLSTIQGPHCLIDFDMPKYDLNTDFALDIVRTLSEALRMKRKNEPRVIRSDDAEKISIYQIVSTSHIIIHFSKNTVNADLFSCEAFDIDRCVSVLTDNLGYNAKIQYCQRNLATAPKESQTIKMQKLNKMTSNPNTFTHALINWYSGDEKLLCDIEYGTSVLKEAVKYLDEENEILPPSSVLLLDVDPVPYSWDKGGFSGGYINIMKQLTMHTFAGLNGAYTDIMAHTFDLEKIISILKKGFKFKFYEVDGIFQR